MPPHQYDPPVAGIICNQNSTINIGDPNSGENLFDGIISPINIDKTNTIIMNNRFKNSQNGGYVIQTNGGGVYPYGSMTIGGSGTNEDNRFEDCTGGIYAGGNINTSILNNTFANITYPIYIEDNFSIFPLFHSIKNNVINDFLRGIEILTSNNISIEISNNDLNYQNNTSTPGLTGIRIYNSTPVKIKSKINYNNITNCNTAIEVMNFRNSLNYSILNPATAFRGIEGKSEIRNNIITFDTNIPNGQYLGIKYTDCHNTKIVDNYFYRNSTNSGSNVIGIKGQAIGYSSIIKGNSFINLQSSPPQYRGIHLFGQCAGVQMYCNDYSYCPEAVYLGISTQQVNIADQVIPGFKADNNWVPLNNTYQRIQGNLPPSTDFSYSGISVSTSNTSYPYSSNANVIPYNVSTSLTDRCNLTESEDDGDMEPERDLDVYINEEKNFETDNDEFQYGAKALVFSYLLDNPSLIENGDYNEWFDDIYDSNMGKLQRVEKMIYDFAPDSSLSYDEAYEEYDQVLSDAMELLETVDAQNDWETNKLFYLNFIISHYLSPSDPTTVELEELNNIACQNSIIGGPAVLWARQYLHLDIDDETGCPELRMRNNFSSIKSSPVIYPNPSLGKIKFNLPSDQIYDFYVYNYSGSLLKVIPSINTNAEYKFDLNNGLYMYKIISNGLTINSGKISLIKAE